ncbi:MAG: hypothetical protein A2252_05320 [Elusimicrobia bacterium RIFOXYA2_FULL_39_19]|nr:MAG: hypothetical protein A2252_05320 [Elusimicrobia bacterium RIFOXYA2_FULL_39_19]
MAKKILLIEDDKDVMEATKAVLRLHHYDVVITSSGERGVEMAQKETPNLIILDLTLPGGMSGYAVCEKIKTNPKTKNIPILILTGKNAMSDLEMALEKGADWYVTKPYDIKYLLKHVESLILKYENKSKDSAAVTPPVKSNKILIVDDDQDAVDTTRETLEYGGYEVVSAYDGDKGLELAQKIKPDLVVLDIMMPGTNGFIVCAKLKTDPATKHIPVLMLTGKDLGEDVEKALEMGADWYVTKPYDIQYLLRNVKKLLQRETLKES